MTSNPILARFDRVPALLNAEQQSLFDSCVVQVGAFLTQNADAIAALAHNDDGFWPEPDSWAARYRPYKVVNGTLYIPVKGVLLHNFPFAFGDWATGYDYITRALQRGLADGSVRRIALLVHSMGGQVAGCFECAEKIGAARGEKPIAAFAHEGAYSAAYAIASAADSITVSRTGGVGSIGVVMSHMDVSGAMEQRGIKITFIHAGKHKVDGNAYEPLPDDVKARMQVRIDELYEVFVSHVARHRGMDEEAVRATEALTYSATESVSNGLADAIGPLDESLASFEAELSHETENETMSTEQDNSAANEAAVNAARTDGIAAGRTEGAKAERERIGAIKALDEAKERPMAAENVAMNTDMSVEQAKTFLAAMPVEGQTLSTDEPTAGAGGNRFDTAMGSTDNPNLDGNSSADGEGDAEAISGDAGANALLAARQQATGFGRKAKN